MVRCCYYFLNHAVTNLGHNFYQHLLSGYAANFLSTKINAFTFNNIIIQVWESWVFWFLWNKKFPFGCHKLLHINPTVDWSTRQAFISVNIQIHFTVNCRYGRTLINSPFLGSLSSKAFKSRQKSLLLTFFLIRFICWRKVVPFSWNPLKYCRLKCEIVEPKLKWSKTENVKFYQVWRKWNSLLIDWMIDWLDDW